MYLPLDKFDGVAFEWLGERDELGSSLLIKQLLASLAMLFKFGLWLGSTVLLPLGLECFSLGSWGAGLLLALGFSWSRHYATLCWVRERWLLLCNVPRKTERGASNLICLIETFDDVFFLTSCPEELSDFEILTLAIPISPIWWAHRYFCFLI